jgi:predicted MPP superfamily phosphohydrolase
MLLISILTMPKITFLIVFLIFVLLDVYAFQSIKLLSNHSKIAKWSYILIHLLFYGYFMYSLLTFKRELNSTFTLQFIVGTFVLLYVPKLFIVVPLLLEDIFRIFNFLFQKITIKNALYPERKKFISIIGLGLASIPFLGIIHGIWKGKYNFKTIFQTLSFEDLPKAFDGFKILQLSDFHVGSFDNKEKVEKIIEYINHQQVDVIVFTGDFVNLVAEELIPYVDVFKKLKSPLGVYSIFGNHDYGTYAYGNDDVKNLKKNRSLLIELNQKLGYDLLLNEQRIFEKNGEKIYLIGVENYGKPPFPQYGNLKKSMMGIPNDAFKVLLSHDPTHFDLEVKDYPSKIHLTLSGHTHGMQFGIELPFFKFSPVQFVYKKWAGLYQENNRFLYVNRGFGYNAFPGRVGIYPEITIFTLKKKN